MARVYVRGGFWYLDYFDAQGVRQRKATGFPEQGYKRRAQELLGKVVERVRLEKAGLTDSITDALREPIETHLATFETHLKNRRATDKHVKDAMRVLRLFFKERRIACLKNLTLREAEAWIAEQDKSSRTVAKYVGFLRQFAKYCYEAGLIGRNQLLALRRPREESVYQRDKLTGGETQRLLRSVPRLRWVAYALAVSTGMRRSEIERTEWKDVNLQECEIRLSKTKNRQPATFFIPENLRDALLWLRDHRDEACKEARVPPHAVRHRRYVFPAMPNARTFKRDLKRAKISRGDGLRLDFHSLRLTYASLLEDRGVSLGMAQKLLRHSTPALTSNVYQKRNDSERREASRTVWGHIPTWRKD